jgi:hypothetical protein
MSKFTFFLIYSVLFGLFLSCGKPEAIIIDDQQGFCPVYWFFRKDGFSSCTTCNTPTSGTINVDKVNDKMLINVTTTQTKEFSLMNVMYRPYTAELLDLYKSRLPYFWDSSFEVKFEKINFDKIMRFSTILNKPSSPSSYLGDFEQQDSLIELILGRNDHGYFIHAALGQSEISLKDSIVDFKSADFRISYHNDRFEFKVNLYDGVSTLPFLVLNESRNANISGDLFAGIRLRRRSNPPSNTASGQIEMIINQSTFNTDINPNDDAIGISTLIDSFECNTLLINY